MAAVARLASNTSAGRRPQAAKYAVDRHVSVLTILVGETFALAIVLEPIKNVRDVARQLYDVIGAVNRAGITAAMPGAASKHNDHGTELVRARTGVVDAARQLSRDTSWSRQAGVHETAPPSRGARLRARLRRLARRRA